MPQRLVYAPKAYVYTKKSDGTILDVSDYVTAGEVDRKIDQVSTAQVTLRNPDRQFTRPAGGVAFHPQDPITIYLERIANHPIRVFTGYLDDTPYYRLYPGTITLQASCTLKRLLYSYFDPSLPYVIAFFEKYGWINTQSGSLISGNAINGKQINTQADVNGGTAAVLRDGSLGKMLWAVLYNFAQWDDANIYIEALPSGANGIAARMAVLMQSLQQQDQQASDLFNQFLESVVGTSSQGSGGGAGANVTNGVVTDSSLTSSQKQEAATLISVGKSLNAPRTAILACLCAGLGESSLGANPETFTGNHANPAQTQGHGYWGVLQGNPNDFPDPHDTAAFATAFYQGGKGFGNGSPTPGTGAIGLVQQGQTDPGTIATMCEDSGQPGSYYGQYLGQAQSILNSYQANAGSTSSTQRGIQALGAGKTQQLIAQNGGTSNTAASNTGNTTGQVTRIQAMLDAAQAIANSKLPYAWGGGHQHAGVPSAGGNADGGGGPIVTGFDCSGTVGAVLAAAGIIPYGGNVNASQDVPSQANAKPGPGQGRPEVTLYANTQHIFMTINGRAFGTAGAGTGTPTGGADWIPGGIGPDTAQFNVYHIPMNILNQTVNYHAPQVSGTATGAPSAGAGGGTTGSRTSAEAFTAELNYPSIEDQVTAIALGAEGKGLMHDQQLMPFVQQLAQASLRSFMSLPNGDFYAFYPDYFGEMGTHQPYWLIDDIEILDGGIHLSDAGLSTHVYAIGDNTWPVNNELMNMLFSAGTITVYNAFLGNMVDTKVGKSGTASSSAVNSKNGKHKGNKHSPATTVDKNPGENLSGVIMKADEAAKFVERYGARPLVQNYPMVRSAIYEMLLAYQQFMTAWSTQFQTPFTFTFMPEVFPGGKVAFPNHGLQMYVNEVVHQWDYAEGGFTTVATLSAPSVYGKVNPDLPPNMIDALVEPLRQKPPGPTGDKSTNTAANSSGTTKQKQKQISQNKVVPSDNNSGTPQGVTNPFGPIATHVNNPFTGL